MSRFDAEVVVLGGGITGLTAALELSKLYQGSVLLLEKAAAVGGLASTVSRDGFSFDTGSHRLHDGYDPGVGALIRDLCGADLLKRQRRGRLYVQNRALVYPPSAFDILTAFGGRECVRFAIDLLKARLIQRHSGGACENFETFTISRVGKSLYERFYKPYAIKLYGLPPSQISKDPAVHRVRKFSLQQLFRDIKNRTLRRRAFYYYPAQGIGQLSRTLEGRILERGGKIFQASAIDPLVVGENHRIQCVSFADKDGISRTWRINHVVSTIPLDALHNSVILPGDASRRPPFQLRWRGLRLLHILTTDTVVGESETYYFPDSTVPFGRVSELNKYSPMLNRSVGRTALTIEIPCSYGDEIWSAPDHELAEKCIGELRRLRVLRQQACTDLQVYSQCLKTVYPVYELGWKDRFDAVFDRLDAIENLYMIGRTALFLHCNIDQCMLMAIRLAEHLASKPQEKSAWRQIQTEFFQYRVRE